LTTELIETTTDVQTSIHYLKTCNKL